MAIKVLGLNQENVLGAAIRGMHIRYAEPGRAHVQDGNGGYCHTKRTIDSLLTAGFLAGSEAAGFHITEAGRVAFDKLPRKSN